MGLDHHFGLLAGYTLACVGVLALAAWRKDLWPRRPLPEFRRPWLEVAFAFLGVIGVIGAGQLWQHGLLLPESNPLFIILNQLVIFAPILVVPFLRRQGPDTAWIQTDRLWLRVIVGVGLAIAALVAYTLVTRGPDALRQVFTETFEPSRLPHVAQVLFEDIGIAILLVRLGAAIRRPWIGVILVATLFAAGHIPALTADGAGAHEYALLLGDVVLGVIVLSALYRTQDILWLWPVHATLDLSQFVSA